MSRNTHCFVPGCKSGYSTKSAQPTTKCSLFKAPDQKLSLWSNAIPRLDRQLTVKDCVCELHFRPEHVIQEDKICVGNDVVVLPRQRPRLHEDAVPCIFPNLPHYLTKEHKLPRRTIVKHCCSAASASTDDELLHVDESSNDTCTSKQITYNDLQESHKCLCPPDWFSKTGDGDSVVCFGKLVVENNHLKVVTCVSVSRDMKVTLFCRDRIVQPVSLPVKITYEQELRTLLSAVDGMKECGGASGHNTEYQQASLIKSRLGWYDECRFTWRHVNCAGLVPSHLGRCLACRRFRKIMQTSYRRKQVNAGRKRKRAQYIRARKVVALKKRMMRFRQTVQLLRKRVQQQPKDVVQNYISDLPQVQQSAFKHCIRQASVRSAKGMRYQNEWLLSCMILRIKSPKAYNHLREHQFLALPAKSTLQRYMDVVRAECGISSESLELIQQKVVTNSERHGIVIFDKIKLRMGVKFDIRTLKFSGLVSFDEFTSSSDRKLPADYGLVFMYRPFLGAWTQTVAMFLSHGPTRTNTLQKLLTKVIVALESLDLWVCIFTLRVLTCF